MYKIPEHTLFLGRNIVFVPECNSTNDLASQLANQPATIEGTVVITHNQTAGRGQRGSSWEAVAGENLTFSLVLRPAFLSIADQFQLTLAISLGIFDFIQNSIPGDVFIKWPNDLLVNRKKICGILIENHLRGSIMQHSIVGIGFNVNQKKFQHAEATSLALLTGRHYGLSDVLNELLNRIEKRYIALRQGRPLLEDYYKSLLGYQTPMNFKAGNRSFNGIITGVNREGRLLIQTESGEEAFTIKEVTLLPSF